jgi:hypothetical protein
MTKQPVTFHNFANAPKNDKAITNPSALNKLVKKKLDVSDSPTQLV